ncbi:MAG: hypothetical protein A3E01_10700 [Gammaproteobacteria bacterium RIFCSPHIGHO2_12_FULL_63_22]|nr:MAG: hypothetical protein A3E01_10700 [Gammaproteobacteria bacterium RIFCSPHIGHO2_12_FULL_63_22]
MRRPLIRFRRLGSERWEIAFSERHLHEKLDGEMAEVEMPAKPWLTRLWLKVCPMRAHRQGVLRSGD